jgi:hypothetical protein
MAGEGINEGDEDLDRGLVEGELMELRDKRPLSDVFPSSKSSSFSSSSRLPNPY